MNHDVVFVHGWGLNSGIWGDYIQQLKKRHAGLTIHCLDLPGYGRHADRNGSSDLSELADFCLLNAPDDAVWVGWSLGGMVALSAAMRATNNKIRALQLITTSAKFVAESDWDNGVDIAVFKRFSDGLAANYEQVLGTFLLLQSGSATGARELAKRAHQAICESPSPTALTLRQGIDCLADADLRDQLSINSVIQSIPTQVLVGSLDRVANPKGGHALADLIDAQLVEFRTGHAPFLTQPDAVIDALTDLLGRV